MSIQTLALTPPPGFDPNNSQHVARILEKVVEAEKKTAGSHVAEEMGENRSDWKVMSYDAVANKLTIMRQSAVTKVDEDRRGVRTVAISSNTKAADAEGIAARLQELHPGYYLSEFNPHLGKAQLTKMTLDEVRVREAIATAIGAKPWDLKVKGSRRNGYQVKLPATYMQSKHDDKVQEVAETVAGEFGWYWESDPVTLTGNIVPSAPPVFPNSVTYPMDLLPKPIHGAIAKLPIGLALAERGDAENEVAYLDFNQGPHLQLGGVSGAGKSVQLNVIIAGALAAGAELVILDVPQKAVDFEKWRPFVRPGGWGAATFEENAVALQELYKEGQKRAEIFKTYGAKKLADLPADIAKDMKPVLIVVDEYTGLLAKPAIPKSLPEDHPLRVEAETKTLAIDILSSYVDKLAAEMRFVGFQIVISTQVASTSTGIGTALRTNLTNKMLLGPRATDGNRKLVFRDPMSVPQVPDHIKSDPDVSRGVGACELEGQRPFVLKGFFATEETLIAELKRRGRKPIPEGQLDSITRPDPRVVRELFPEFGQVQVEEKKYGKGPQKVQDWQIDPNTGERLDPMQAANRAKHLLTVQAKQAEQQAQG